MAAPSMTNPLTTLTTHTASLFDPAGRFTVLDSCSGINSLKALAALAIIMAFMDNLRPSRACVLLIAACTLSILFNQIRVIALILLSNLPPTSWQTAHTILGYLSVIPSVYILSHLSERFRKNET